MTKVGVVVGTGPSLAAQIPTINQSDALTFTCNRTFEDVRTDVWLACDPQLHDHYGQVKGDFDCWHWDRGICDKYGYRYVEGVWIIDGKAYPRDEMLVPVAPVGGLWVEDKTRISLNHCSGAQLLNLAVHYECDRILLVGHDFRYPEGKPRHYFNNLSETKGEYPQEIRKYSAFDKKGEGDDLLAVYRRIAEQDGLPEIINCTPGSALPWFPMGGLEDELSRV